MTLKTFIINSVLFFPRRINSYLIKPVKEYFEGPDSIVERKALISIMKKCNTKDYSYIVRKRLVTILKAAYKNVPYWKQYDFFKKVNTKNCIDCINRLPLLTKEIIRLNSEKMWKVGCNMENTGHGTTGATTGEPLKFLYDSPHEPSHQKALYEYMTGLEFEKYLNYDGKIINFGGSRPTNKDLERNIFWIKRPIGIYGSYDFCCFYLNENTISYYVKKLNELQPIILRGYSNSILQFAELVKQFGGTTFNLKAIYVTSEYCSKKSMQFISDVFNCPCFGQYGQSEALHFSWTDANNDEYYVSPFYGFVEVVDEFGKAVPEGEVGELAVTSLSNKNQPFIRYLTGDRVTYGGKKNGIVCIKNLQGRKTDYLIGSDNLKYYTVGWLDVHYMKCTSSIKSYQFFQNEPGKVTVRLVLNKNINSNISKSEVEEEFCQLLSLRKISAKFEYLNEIPLTNRGKRRIVIQNIQ